MNVVRLGAIAAGIGLAYLRWGRPWVLGWGATAAERSTTLPGDEILDAAAIQTTRAVTVEAGVEHIWPWIVQMGPRPRAGVYTYDWIERMLGIDIENADRILPEFQTLAVGERFTLNESSGLTVRRVEPGRALVLQWTPNDATWTFALLPDGPTRTRLLSRNRIPGGGVGFWAGMVPFMEPGSLVMERKMLLGIKERAERLAGAPA
jgi:hypothetical protein